MRARLKAAIAVVPFDQPPYSFSAAAIAAGVG
jgi:hypothetical protein